MSSLSDSVERGIFVDTHLAKPFLRDPHNNPPESFLTGSFALKQLNKLLSRAVKIDKRLI
jgi:hypothetical protein